MTDQKAPPTQDTGKDVQNEDSYEIDDNKWNYYERDNDYLLRYGKVENVRGVFIRFDVLNTKIISVDKKMFTGNEKITKLNEDLKTPKNFELLTYLAMNFEKISPEFKYVPDNNDISLIISNEENKVQVALRIEDCKDTTFFNKNIERKIKQIEEKLEAKKAEFEKENKKLIEINEQRTKELYEIKKINEDLETENFKVSKALKELIDKQNEAIEQLRKIN